jgi:hypothetical protein
LSTRLTAGNRRPFISGYGRVAGYRVATYTEVTRAGTGRVAVCAGNLFITSFGKAGRQRGRMGAIPRWREAISIPPAFFDSRSF